MSSPRERGLALAIKNKLLGIQKSEQIYKSLSKWEDKFAKMNIKEIQKAANIIASKVELYALSIEKRTKKPVPDKALMNKISKELEEYDPNK